MAWYDFFKKKNTSKNEALPVASSGRLSMPDGAMGVLRNGGKELMPLFQVKQIEELKALSVWNRHVSKLVNDIAALANTNYHIELPDGLSPRIRNKIMTTIRDFEVNYQDGKGLQSFVKNALSNLAVAGSLPAEVVVQGNPYPNNIYKVAILNAANIRFQYNPSTNSFLPYQYVNYNWQRLGETIALNPKTFIYITLREIEESPYGIPELLSSLEDLALDAEMIGDFKKIIRNSGLMGFLTVFVQAPNRKAGESEEAYFQRTLNYLQSNVVPDAERGLRSGVMAGFKGATDIEFKANNANYTGADKAFEIVNKRLYNGMKSHGLFFGETGAITETFAKVILQVMMSMVGDYQYAVASALQKVFLILLELKGYDLPYIKVSFESAMLSDELKDAETEQIRIANVEKKLLMGIISLDQAAQELGYDKPTSMPYNVATIGNTNRKKQSLASRLSYEDCLINGFNCNCGSVMLANDFTLFDNDFLNEKVKAYSQDVGKVFTRYFERIANGIKVKFNRTKEIEEGELLQEALVQSVLHLNDFERELEGVDDYVNQVYRRFREDKSIFPKSTSNKKIYKDEGFVPPEAILDLLDLRLIEYMTEADRLYLGKYVIGQMRTELDRFIKEWYVANDGRIGDSGTFERFINEFGKYLEGKAAWVIRRIIDTTMNNARSYAHVKYMNQAGVLRFRRVEVGDSLTCAHCQAVNGMEFEVAKEIRKAQDFVEANVENIEQYAPFATKIPISNFEKMTAEEMQAEGVGCNALHPHCRGRNVAVL
jgi:hypothetical protein